MNEVTISRAEYDLMLEHRMMLNMYQKALTKCARFSEWRNGDMAMDDDDFLELVSLFDYATYCDVQRHCERQKAEAEKKKAAAASSIHDLKTEIETKVRAAAAEIKEDES